MKEYRSSLFKKVPKFMLEKRNQIIMVLFVSIFAIAFINIFNPFASKDWIKGTTITETKYFLWSTLLVLIGMIVVAVSRIIMYRFSQKPTHNITILKYIGWVFVEVLLLSGAFTILALIVHSSLNLTASDPMEIFTTAIQNTIYILFIPYLLCIMYFSYQDKNLKLKELMDESIGFKSSNLISIRDSRGVLQLSVAKENLIYI